MDGITKPNAKKEDAYSFTKAPRYQEKVVQTGPLGEELALESKLFSEFYEKYSDSTFVRELARMLRPIRFIEAMQKDIYDVIQNKKEPLYIKPKIKSNTQGIGLTHAARGALGHWIKIKNGKISNYQIISPTTWNGSPKDKNGNLGVWEKALIGVKIKDIDNPMEMGHIIRSFDPCLVCTVHFIGKDKKTTLKV
jgi:hydrogenase large subunit